jgi:hypothetical protein
MIPLESSHFALSYGFFSFFIGIYFLPKKIFLKKNLNTEPEGGLNHWYLDSGVEETAPCVEVVIS